MEILRVIEIAFESLYSNGIKAIWAYLLKIAIFILLM
jgi:hypothetical protein